MSKQHTPKMVSRTATCKRCNSKTVTWQKSAAGKWFLTEVFVYPRGDDSDNDEMSAYTDFHSTYCAKPEAHWSKQAEIMQEHANWRAKHVEVEAKAEAQRIENEAKAEAQRIEVEAEKLATFLRSTLEERQTIIGDLERTIKREAKGLTMDYMSEFNRSCIIIESCKVELAMYADFMEDVEDD